MLAEHVIANHFYDSLEFLDYTSSRTRFSSIYRSTACHPEKTCWWYTHFPRHSLLCWIETFVVHKSLRTKPPFWANRLHSTTKAFQRFSRFSESPAMPPLLKIKLSELPLGANIKLQNQTRTGDIQETRSFFLNVLHLTWCPSQVIRNGFSETHVFLSLIKPSKIFKMRFQNLL